MATLIDFQPGQGVPPFQFQATLDGAAYNVIVTWLWGGQRWYLSLFDQSNNWIFTRAMVGSPPDYDISLTAGYFTTKLVYRVSTNQFEVSG
jgi:hypothetical protein